MAAILSRGVKPAYQKVDSDGCVQAAFFPVNRLLDVIYW